MKRMLSTAMIASAVLLAGCATTPRAGPINVTRFHLGNPIAGDSISVEPLTGFAGTSPEDPVYLGAVGGELTKLGFKPGGGDASPYIAAVSYKHEAKGNATATELSVQIKRRSDRSILWEGRAVAEEAGSPSQATANRLAKALFKGFPGESGVTITVK